MIHPQTIAIPIKLNFLLSDYESINLLPYQLSFPSPLGRDLKQIFRRDRLLCFTIALLPTVTLPLRKRQACLHCPTASRFRRGETSSLKLKTAPRYKGRDRA